MLVLIRRHGVQLILEVIEFDVHLQALCTRLSMSLPLFSLRVDFVPVSKHPLRVEMDMTADKSHLYVYDHCVLILFELNRGPKYLSILRKFDLGKGICSLQLRKAESSLHLLAVSYYPKHELSFGVLCDKTSSVSWEWEYDLPRPCFGFLSLDSKLILFLEKTVSVFSLSDRSIVVSTSYPCGEEDIPLYWSLSRIHRDS